MTNRGKIAVGGVAVGLLLWWLTSFWIALAVIVGVPAIAYLALDPSERATIWSVPVGGGMPRLLVRFDDPTREWHRFGFKTRRGRFYFTVGDRQSDVWMAEAEKD